MKSDDEVIREVQHLYGRYLDWALAESLGWTRATSCSVAWEAPGRGTVFDYEVPRWHGDEDELKEIEPSVDKVQLLWQEEAPKDKVGITYLSTKTGRQLLPWLTANTKIEARAKAAFAYRLRYGTIIDPDYLLQVVDSLAKTAPLSEWKSRA